MTSNSSDNPALSTPAKVRVLGEPFSTTIGKTEVVIQKSTLADFKSAKACVLFVSRSLVLLGRDGSSYAPKESPLDQALIQLYEKHGTFEFGRVVEMPNEVTATLGRRVVCAVVPRDTLRRDTTKEYLFGALVHAVKSVYEEDSTVVVEAIDGNKIFRMPQVQIVETIFDALSYVLLRYPKSGSKLVILSDSSSITELYISVFSKKLTGELQPFSEDDTATDEEHIKAYGNMQRQIYNKLSADGIKHKLYDIFVLLERTFAQPRRPVSLKQLKYYLRQVHNATDTELDALIARRQQEAVSAVAAVANKVGRSASQIFKEMCYRHVQFAKEILQNALTDYNNTEPFASKDEFNSLMTSYFADDSLDSTLSRSKSKELPQSRSSIRINRSSSRAPHFTPPRRKSDRKPARGFEIRLGDTKLTPQQTKLAKLLLNNDKLLEAMIDSVESADMDKLANILTKTLWFGDKIMNFIRIGIRKEVEKTTDPSTLFRQNSLITKVMTAFSKLVAADYLLEALQPTVNKLKEMGTIEVDPSKMKDPRHIGSNREKMQNICNDLLRDITASIDKLPIECRLICSELKTEVSKKFPDSVCTAIAGYLCLRLINPVLAVPETIGLLPATGVTQDLRRSLVLLSKIFQNIANNVPFSKEQYMTHFNPFIEAKFSEFQSLLLECAVVPEDKVGTEHPLLIKPQQFVEELNSLLNFIRSATKLTNALVSSQNGDIAEELKELVASQQ